MAKLIDLGECPHNKDITAKLVWEDRRTGDGVYQVRAGYLACVDYPHRLEPVFASQDAAISALREHRAP